MIESGETKQPVAGNEPILFVRQQSQFLSKPAESPELKTYSFNDNWKNLSVSRDWVIFSLTDLFYRSLIPIIPSLRLDRDVEETEWSTYDCEVLASNPATSMLLNVWIFQTKVVWCRRNQKKMKWWRKRIHLSVAALVITSLMKHSLGPKISPA